MKNFKRILVTLGILLFSLFLLWVAKKPSNPSFYKQCGYIYSKLEKINPGDSKKVMINDTEYEFTSGTCWSGWGGNESLYSRKDINILVIKEGENVRSYRVSSLNTFGPVLWSTDIEWDHDDGSTWEEKSQEVTVALRALYDSYGYWRWNN